MPNYKNKKYFKGVLEFGKIYDITLYKNKSKKKQNQQL